MSDAIISFINIFPPYILYITICYCQCCLCLIHIIIDMIIIHRYGEASIGNYAFLNVYVLFFVNTFFKKLKKKVYYNLLKCAYCFCLYSFNNCPISFGRKSLSESFIFCRIKRFSSLVQRKSFFIYGKYILSICKGEDK